LIDKASCAVIGINPDMETITWSAEVYAMAGIVANCNVTSKPLPPEIALDACHTASDLAFVAGTVHLSGKLELIEKLPLGK
jgi:hypothetical protein